MNSDQIGSCCRGFALIMNILCFYRVIYYQSCVLTQIKLILFVGHGIPMNTLGNNEFTWTWREMANSLPRPKAILATSAHWEIRGTYNHRDGAAPDHSR